jgi:hypothetical protein
MARTFSLNRAFFLSLAGLAASLFLLAWGSVTPAEAQSTFGSRSVVTGYLWSPVAGWISMSCQNGGTCGTADYGVYIYSGATTYGPQGERTTPVTGFAWSENMGWICFGITCDESDAVTGDVVLHPEGLTEGNYADFKSISIAEPYRVRLYGWARVLNLRGGGWIQLNCDNQVLDRCESEDEDPDLWPTSPLLGTGEVFYVAYDSDTNHFCDTGKCVDPLLPPGCDPNIPNDCDAYPGHWSWNANDNGTGIGWVDWSEAESTWQPPYIKQVIRPQGIYEPASSPVAGVHPSTFEYSADDVHAPVDYMLRCDLLKANGERVINGEIFTDGDRNGVRITFQHTIPQSENFPEPPADLPTAPIQQNRLWYVDGCYLAAEPTADACTVDSDCLNTQACDYDVPGGAGFCRDIIYRTTEKPVYVHRNKWTLFNDNEDFYQAFKCYAEFHDSYFENSHQCDFTGDVTFSMAMNKGIPIERECGNGLDDDGNGLFDCDDPFCRTSAHLCDPGQPALACDRADLPSDLRACNSVQYERGDLCCSEQNRIVNGLECRYLDTEDGYFDCECVAKDNGDPPPVAYDVYAPAGTRDCVAPYYTYGELCCTPNNEVIRMSEL